MRNTLEAIGQAMPVLRQGAKRLALDLGVDALEAAVGLTDCFRSVGKIDNLIRGRETSPKVELLDLAHRGISKVSDRVRAAAERTVQI